MLPCKGWTVFKDSVYFPYQHSSVTKYDQRHEHRKLCIHLEMFYIPRHANKIQRSAGVALRDEFEESVVYRWQSRQARGFTMPLKPSCPKLNIFDPQKGIMSSKNHFTTWVLSCWAFSKFALDVYNFKSYHDTLSQFRMCLHIKKRQVNIFIIIIVRKHLP